MVSNVTPGTDRSIPDPGLQSTLSSRPLLSVGLAIVGIRIHTCVFVLPLPATPIYHTGVQTTVSSYRMVHHGVSVTYTLFGYPASRPRLLPSFSFLTRAVYARLRLSRAASVRASSFLRRRSLRWPRCFAKRERLYPARSTDNRRATFFVITPLSLFSINSDFRNENFKIFSSKFISISGFHNLSKNCDTICPEIKPLNLTGNDISPSAQRIEGSRVSQRSREVTSWPMNEGRRGIKRLVVEKAVQVVRVRGEGLE